MSREQLVILENWTAYLHSMHGLSVDAFMGLILYVLMPNNLIFLGKPISLILGVIIFTIFYRLLSSLKQMQVT